jgi:protoporphyrinogen/coproporphyrinogen III oxidase
MPGPSPVHDLEPYDVAVVGAGISGLTVAFRLQRAGRRVVVLEAGPEPGGVLQTHREGPWRFELGPNTVVENHPSLGALIADAGLAAEKLTAVPSAKRRYLWKGGRLVPLPGGPVGFLRTPLFPARAKLRLLREPWIAPAPAGCEESIADFVRRRLGQDFLDYAVGPFVSGVYAGDPERLSVEHAVPRIAALERRYGSLIRGALARRKGPAPGGAMISFRDGLDRLPRALAGALAELRTGVTVRRVLPIAEGFRIETEIGGGHGGDGDGPDREDGGDHLWVTARRVVLAAGAAAAAALLDEASGGRSRAFAAIPYAAVAVVGLGYRREDVAHPLDGFGFLAPRVEDLRILGCLFPSSIFPGRAPGGHVALSAFAGGRTDPEAAALPGAELLALVERDVRRALGVCGEPVVRVVRRWPRAIPQYELGHGRFLALAEEIERDLPGIHLAGNYLQGVSVPDCIRNATTLAESILASPAGPPADALR